MNRYKEAPDSVNRIVKNMIRNRFQHLASANIIVLMDNKTKIHKPFNRITLASVKLSNEVEKFLTRDYNREEVHYFIFIGQLVWDLASKKDRRRIISHELRHCFIDDKDNYRILEHDIQDFHEEIKLNVDDPKWASSLCTRVIAKLDLKKTRRKKSKRKITRRKL